MQHLDRKTEDICDATQVRAPAGFSLYLELDPLEPEEPEVPELPEVPEELGDFDVPLLPDIPDEDVPLDPEL